MIYATKCLSLLGIICFSKLGLACASPEKLTPRPNIIFILADDLGYGDLGVFWQNQRRQIGDRSKPWHTTPHIDRLAAEGIALPHQYCAAPVCAPSRASLLSGLHQGHANVRDNQFDKALEDNHNLATVLKTAGYATACIGKWGLAGKSPNFPAHPLNRGFDEFFGLIRHTDGHDHYPKDGPYRGPKEVWKNHKEVSGSLAKCYTTDLFTARAKHWITKQHELTPKQPFFLYLAFSTPHAVLELPTQPYPIGGLQWLGEPGHMINTASGEIDSWIHPDYANATWDHDKNPSTPEVAWPDVYQRYATSVRRIDDSVGDLLQQLKNLDIDRETLVVFTSDNGPSVESYLDEPYSPEFFGSYGPFSGIKRDVWEGGIRVGAIVRWPARIPPGRTSDLPCCHWDWLPTFAEIAGLPAPARTDGRSLLPTLTTHGLQRLPTIYIEYNVGGTTPAFSEFPTSVRGRTRGQMQMIRKNELTGLRVDITRPQTEFGVYDVIKDPRQSTNLAAQEINLETPWNDAAMSLRRPLIDAPRPYDDTLIPSVTPKNLENGKMDFAIYPGTWPWLPDFDSLDPLEKGRSSSLDPASPARDSPHGLRLKGYFHAPIDGEYTFHLQSANRAQLRLHQALVIDNDYRHTPSLLSASIQLREGYHPLCLDSSYPTDSDRQFQLECNGPNLPRQAIMNSKFCGTETP